MREWEENPDGFPKADGVKVLRLKPKSSKKEGDRPSALARTGSNELLKMEFPPVRWAVEGYVPEGFSVLAGRQKLGKTWLAMDMAIAKAAGGSAMGSVECGAAGDVLYIDMENGLRRIQRRLNYMFPSDFHLPDMSRLEWVTDAPQLDAGFLDALDEWREAVPTPSMVVIDVLQRIKPAGVASRNSYENDYSIWSPLQRWATHHGVAVVGLHHTRKGGADDPLEALSGSNGLSACADTTLVLDRDANGMTLYVRGRDIEERETALKFDHGQWTILGEAHEVKRSDERRLILDALAESDEPMSPTELAAVTGMRSNNLRKLLHTMGKAGEIQKTGRGRYIHPAANVTDEE